MGLEGYSLTIRGSKLNEDIATMVHKYNNMEILETCEIDVVKVDRISDEQIEELIKMKNNPIK